MCYLAGLPSGFRLNEAGSTWVTLTRTGEWNHASYGQFEISAEMLQRMVANFEADTYGQAIFIDVGHRPDDGSAGEIKELRIEGNRLRARVEWTEWGVEQVKEKGFRYFSVDFTDDYRDPETDQRHGPVLFGAALTTRPFVKRLDPLELSESAVTSGRRVLMHPELRRQLSEHLETVKMNWLNDLRKKLSALGLAVSVIDQLINSAKAASKHLGEDAEALKQLSAEFESTGKALAESVGDKEVKLAIDLTGVAGKAEGQQLSEEAVAAIVAKQLSAAKEAADAAQRKLAEDTASRRKLLSDTINAAEGLDDATKKQLSEQVADLVTPAMTDEQIRKLAEYQIGQARQLEAARQLSALGYRDSRTGSPSISIDDVAQVKKLSEAVRESLALTTAAANGGLRLAKEENAFTKRVLSEFDRMNARALAHEHRVMLSGDVDTGRTSLPVSFQREVIREALSDLRVLELVQTLTDFGATATTQIPYEERDAVSAILNDGVVYEGQAIPTSGIEQKMDLAYILPMKLAMKLTNEVMHFTQRSGINWDAWGRNIESNARAMRELLARRICNELQRVADSFEATAVAAENVAAQLDGTESIITLANFPVVRPHQTRDLKGNAVGSAQNPITVTLNAVVAPAWDGSGTQAAGNYWRPYNFNLGQIQLVDEAGDPVTPDLDASTATVGYSYATNVTKFDIKLPANTLIEDHLNGALRAVGAGKALLRSERYVEPNFQLMSPVLNDTLTNAKQFEANSRRSGSDTDPMGDLERIKGIDAWSTNAPNVDLGDERVVIGIRGQLSYVQAKPWQITGQPFEAVDSNGRPTGQKVAYGEEYSAIHVPVPLRGRMTSVLVYNSDDRA